MKSLIIKSQMLHYFIVMFKKRNYNLKSSFLFLDLNLTNIQQIRIRRYVYIYNLYLALNINYFPSYIYNHFVFVEDYFLLGMLDYSYKVKREVFQRVRHFIYKRNSKFFLKKFSKLLQYNLFNIRIHWFGYLSLGKYVEYFRYFKYLEYLKRIPNNISYRFKNIVRSRYLPEISLLNKHKLTLAQHNYVFFYDTRSKDAYSYIFLCKNVKLLAKKLSFSLTFGGSAIFYKYLMSLFSKFNNFSFIWFTHRVWFSFKYRLKEYAKFRSLLPRFWFSSLKNLKFAFTKWFFRYFLKTSYFLSNKVNFFITFKSIPWFYTIDLVLFHTAHRVHYHRILTQLDKDVIKN